MKHILHLAISVLACISSARAQTGTDTCTTPDPLIGTGTFNFDNTNATTGSQGQTEALCSQFGDSTVLKDVWFDWTAPVSGIAIIKSCGITTVDTKIAIYAGSGCPAAGSAIACNDDNCGGLFQSTLSANVIAGNSYVIQVGLYPGIFPPATPGAGQFSIDILIPPSNDDCSTPVAIAGPGVYTANNIYASTGAEGQNEALCNQLGFTAVKNDVWFEYTATTNGTVTVSTCGVLNASVLEDSKIAIYAGAGCPTSGSALVCNDDACASSPGGYESTVSFAAVCGTTYTIQFGMYGGGGLGAYYNGDVSITETGGAACGPVATPFCDGSVIGTTCVACGNNGAAGSGCANSSFATGASLAAGGSASVGADTLVLTASSVTGPGLFFQSNGLASIPVTFGDGMLCASVGIVRMGVVFPVAGSAAYPSGAAPTPITSAGGPIVAGDVKHYQCWYRDAVTFCSGDTFNLTQGVSVTWVP